MPAYDTPPPPPMALIRERPRRGGRVLLITGGGLVAGVLGLLALQQGRLASASAIPRERSLVKTAKLAQAALLYAEDHEYFPGGYGWGSHLEPYGIKSPDYASPLNIWSQFNIRSGSERQTPDKLKSPETYALFFDSFGGPRAATFPTQLGPAWNFANYRNGRQLGNVFSFADGHSAFIPQDAWDPEDMEKGPVR